VISPEQLAMLKELQAIEFTCLDLHLYLDTHPCDECAKAEHRAVKGQLMEMEAEYERLYGPLTACSNNTESYPAWICEPWPWEIEY